MLRHLKASGILFAICLLRVFTQLPEAQAQIDTVGFTQYDLQAIGSAGGRIAVDGDGGVHVVYLGSSSFPATRSVYYAYRAPNADWATYNLGVGRGGFSQIALNSTGNPAIGTTDTYGRTVVWTPTGAQIVDSTGGWPHLCYDNRDDIHLLFSKYINGNYEDLHLCYTRSTDNGVNWFPIQEIDTVGLPGAIAVASPVSNKVAIVYAQLMGTGNLYHNNILYIESQDGINWDFQYGKINITDYESGPNFATNDFDAIYDNNDLLNIVWASQNMDSVTGPVYLWNYNSDSGGISEISHTSIVWPSQGCNLGTWNTAIGKVSLARSNSASQLSIAYSTYSPYDCSASGFANAEICYQYSDDSGLSWFSPIDLTNTHTPGCEAGHCDSETYPTLAKGEDGVLHLFFVDDKDAGGIPYSEGSVTDNPLIYMTSQITRVDVDNQIPAEFSLSQNYPNPFNAVTTIRIEIAIKGHIDLSIYDISGARVATLIDDIRGAGAYDVKWDAGNLSSGAYFCRASMDGKAISQKMILLK